MHLRGMGNQENQYLVLNTIMSGGTGWEVEGGVHGWPPIFFFHCKKKHFCIKKDT